MKVSRILPLLVIVLSGPLQAQEQASDPGSQKFLFLFNDDKALKVGDVVTVLITQNASATSSAQRETKQGDRNSRSGSAGLLSIPTSSENQSSSQSSTASRDQRGLTLLATVATKVVEVLPNGNLRIDGMQEIEIERRKQSIKISGVIRPQDVRNNNTILSTAIADAKVEFKGNWLGKQRRTPGPLGVLWNVLKLPLYFLF